MKTPTKNIHYQDRGLADWRSVNKNFEDISDDIDELDTRADILDKRTPIQTITYLLEAEGYVTVLTAKEHGNLAMKLVHGFVMKADNVKENTTVHILRTNRDLCEPVTVKGTEKSGKCQSFVIYKTQVVGKMEDIKLYSNSRCKVVVTLIFKPVERE